MPSEPQPAGPGSPTPAPQPGLTVAAVARLLGIAPATLRTWDRRYGIGPTEHTPGKHRRFSPDDVTRLELMQHALVRGVTPADAARYALSNHPAPADPAPSAAAQVLAEPPPEHAGPGLGDPQEAAPQAEPHGRTDELDNLVGDDRGADDGVRVGGQVLHLPATGRRARGLGRAALALDALAAHDLLTESVAAIGLEATWDDVVRPVLRAVAHRWAATGSGIEIEHMLSECVSSVFSGYAASVAGEAHLRPVLLAGMPGDLHILPLTVLAATLAGRGVRSRHLGPNLPADALVAAVRRTAPSVVVLWSQLAETADVDVLRSLPQTRPRYRTFVAGPGWADVVLPPRVGRLDVLDEACATVASAALG